MLYCRYWREWLRCRSWLWTQSSIWHSTGARPVTRRVRTSRHKTLTTLASSSTATPCCCSPKWWVLAQKSIWVHFLVGMRSLAWRAIEAICATLGTTICSVTQTLYRLWLAEEIHTGLAPYPPQGVTLLKPQLARRTIVSPFFFPNPDSSFVSRDFTISPCWLRCQLFSTHRQQKFDVNTCGSVL